MASCPTTSAASPSPNPPSSFTAKPSPCPNAPNQPATRGIVQAGKLAAPISLDSRQDSLAFEARFHLAREQLLADQEARLHLRLHLTNYGHEIPLDRIKDPALVLKAELLGGVTTERVIAENLALTPVLEVPFQVPADLLKLTLTLRGTVNLSTGGDPLKLEDEAIYQINTDLKQDRIGTAYFSPTTTGHRLEVRGRNGEPLPSRALTLICACSDYHSKIELKVRTDASGRVDLGKFDGIDRLSATGTDIAEASYTPHSRVLNCTSTLHLPPLSEIRLPLEKPSATPNRLEFSLLETLDKIPVRDHFDKLTIEDGLLVIRKLPPGDFTLTQGDETIEIQISSGIATGGLLVSKTRILPLHSPPNPIITSTNTANDELKIQLRDFGQNTRISIIGNRYHHDWNGGSALYLFAPPVAGSLKPGFLSCGFLIGRRLSDEMRYILDRRFAQIFPGFMLPRPGLLLNRWTDEDMLQDSEKSSGGAFGNIPSTGIPACMVKRKPSDRRDGDSDANLATVCDFLEMPAVVKFNLTPKADGSLTLPLGNFTGSQFLQITVTDAFADNSIILPLPASETPVRDRRIARPLDPKAHHLVARSAAVLTNGATAAIENLLDADWRAFSTLTEAHQFLYGMSTDERIRQLVFLTEWPTFDEAKKLDLLSKHACHELHLFLARKDKAFFEKHIQPLLAQKPEPRFMDDYLLGSELISYLRPYAWQRLNAAEKALLAQALPEAQQKRIVRELSLHWELEAPAPDAETLLFTQTLRGSDLALKDSLGLARRDVEVPKSLAASDSSDGSAYITEKLRRIIIPHIDFEDTTVEEAIDFLRLRAAELDTLELDPSRKGMNINLHQGVPSNLKIKELKLRNVPIAVALKYVCDAAKLRYNADDLAITLTPQTESGEDVFTRTFKVPPDFAESLDSSDDGGIDPFADPQVIPKNSTMKKSIVELLKSTGVAFPEGSSAILSDNGMLLVTNTPTELDKIEQLTMAVCHSSPTSGRQVSARGFASGGGIGLEEGEGDPFAAGVLPPLDADPFAAPSGGGAALLKARAPQRFPDRTKLWREANYYHNTAPTDESLIPLNRFWLDSPLLEVRPRVHHDWETLEFDPLINPRAHRFGENPRMSHEQARIHYQEFLDQLAWKPALDASDQLDLTAYLLLQDRIAEALERFQKIDPEKLPGRVNYDYLHAIALFYQEKPGEAKAIATAALPKLPPGVWRDRFQAVIDQSDEIAALAGPEKSEKPAKESAAPQLEISLADGGNLVIRHHKLEKATLRLFSVDFEMLFSKNPFLQGGTDSGEPTIRPNEILEIPLAANVSETTVEIPTALRKGNVLVSAESGSTKLLSVLDSRSIELRHLPDERTVQVLDATTSKPLVKTYVKVYAEMRNGEIDFHKDGYTDLRGKFDYLSHTGSDPSTIKRVAILTSHPAHGARTVIYDR